MFVVKNLSKNLGGRPIIQNINFCLKKGEIIALVGKNGAGKTTLMRSMSGYYDLDEGEVNFNNVSLATNREAFLEKLKQYRDYATKTCNIKFASSKPKIVPQPVRAAENPPKPANQTYTVVRGDCLWNIAKKYYGNGSKYTVTTFFSIVNISKFPA